MTISKELLDELLKGVERPEVLLGEAGLMKGYRRIADIGVDLDQEIATDDHRLGFGMVDIGRDYRPSARHLVAHEFGGDEIRDGGAEVFAVAHHHFSNRGAA